jgi:hypothetical protein
VHSRSQCQGDSLILEHLGVKQHEVWACERPLLCPFLCTAASTQLLCLLLASNGLSWAQRDEMGRGQMAPGWRDVAAGTSVHKCFINLLVLLVDMLSYNQQITWFSVAAARG